ncbi:hypothetical protein [Stutzerimonas stutzeri]|nr:hypothetical protein [Stutzerimonas stutzeri]
MTVDVAAIVHRIIPLSYAPAFIRGQLVVGAWALADTRPVDETVP